MINKRKNNIRQKSFYMLLCFSLIFMANINIAFAASVVLDINNIRTSEYNMALVKKQLVPALDAWIYEYKRATVIYLDNNKNEKAFSIGFKTPPANDHGANHVLEHSVLCGSKKYPSLNMQRYMQSTSVPTFMNAFTGNDCTFYAVASKNQAFQNLVDVYLNGVFEPMLLEEENIFKREGVRLEYSEGKIQYSGVVYSEIRGKDRGSDGVDSQINEAMYSALYGDGRYNRDSGGSISEIEQLSYEEVLATFKNYYKPSNSIVILSGSQDLRWAFSTLNNYLNKFDNGETKVIDEFTDYIAQNATVNIVSEKQSENNVSAGILFSGPKLASVKEVITFNALSSLIHSQLKQNGEDTLIVGWDMEGIASTGYISLDIESKEMFLKEYNEITKSLYEKPLDYKEWSQCLSDGNISLNDHIYNLSDIILKGFIYGNDPFLYISSQTIYDNLNCSENEGYVKNVLEKYFIHNKNMAIGEARNGTEKTNPKIKQYSQDEIQKIKIDTEQYEKWSNAPEAEEILIKRPTLSLSDFRDIDLGFSTATENIQGVEYYYTITDKSPNPNLSFVFDVTNLNQEQLLDAKLLVDLYNAYIAKNGIEGIAFNIATYNDFYDRKKYSSALNVTLTGKERDMQDKIERLAGILGNPDILGGKEMKNEISIIKGNVDFYVNKISPIFDYVATPTAYGNRFSLLSYGIGGYGTKNYFEYLSKYTESIKLTDLKERLETTSKIVFNLNQLSISITGNESDIKTLKEYSKQFFACLENTKYETVPNVLPEAFYSMVLIDNSANENLVLELAVSGNVTDKGYVYSSKLKVLMTYIESAYLYPAMRGLGAYDVHTMTDTDGTYMFSIGKAPDVQKVMEILFGIKDFINNSNITQAELDNIIISCVNEWDGWFDISAEPQIGFAKDMALRGYTKKDILKTRSDILSTSVNDLSNLVKMIEYKQTDNIFMKSNNIVLEGSGLKFESVTEILK